MILYRSFYEAIIELPESNQLEIMKAIFEYGFDGVEPNLSGLSKTIWILIKPNLEANRRKWENGCQPKQKQSGSKTEAKPKQGKSKTEGNVDVDVDVDKDLEEDENENENDNTGNNEPPNKRFVPPTIEEVAEYVKSKHPLATNDKVLAFAEKFWSHYENKSWSYNGNKKMKSWHLAMPQWKETIEKTLYQNNNGYKAPASPPKKNKVEYYNTRWPDRIYICTEEQFQQICEGNPEESYVIKRKYSA